VFTGAQQYDLPNRSSAWGAELVDGHWRARQVYTSMEISFPFRGDGVEHPTVARTRSRAAWSVISGAILGEVFVVTGDEMREPRRFRAVDRHGSYWFSPELDRFAYVVGDELKTVRIMSLLDSSAVSVLGDLTIASLQPIVWGAWSQDGTAFAFATDDPTSFANPVEIYVARIRNGVLEPAQLLGATLDGPEWAAQWEP
jgi:hypothetical protein